MTDLADICRCGKTLPPYKGTGRRRVHCSSACTKAARAERLAALAAEPAPRCEKHEVAKVMSQRGWRCNPCRAESLNRSRLAWANRNALLRKYGITEDDYVLLNAAQEGRCPGCGATTHDSKTTRRLAVDHDHDSGHVRGLLCLACNRIVGLAGDDPGVLQRLAAYLAEPPAKGVLWS